MRRRPRLPVSENVIVTSADLSADLSSHDTRTTGASVPEISISPDRTSRCSSDPCRNEASKGALHVPRDSGSAADASNGTKSHGFMNWLLFDHHVAGIDPDIDERSAAADLARHVTAREVSANGHLRDGHTAAVGCDVNVIAGGSRQPHVGA